MAVCPVGQYLFLLYSKALVLLFFNGWALIADYLTVTLYVTLYLPIFAVITALPFFFAITLPELLTASTAGLFDDHFTFDNLTP